MAGKSSEAAARRRGLEAKRAVLLPLHTLMNVTIAPACVGTHTRPPRAQRSPAAPTLLQGRVEARPNLPLQKRISTKLEQFGAIKVRFNFCVVLNA